MVERRASSTAASRSSSASRSARRARPQPRGRDGRRPACRSGPPGCAAPAARGRMPPASVMRARVEVRVGGQRLAADRTTGPGRAPARRRSPPAGRWAGRRRARRNPRTARRAPLRVVEARTVAWVSSWVMTTSRPSGRSDAPRSGHEDDPVGPGMLPRGQRAVRGGRHPREVVGGATEQACGIGVGGGGDPDGRSGLPPDGGDTRPRPCARGARPPRPGRRRRRASTSDGGRPADDESGEVPGLRAPGRAPRR